MSPVGVAIPTSPAPENIRPSSIIHPVTPPIYPSLAVTVPVISASVALSLPAGVTENSAVTGSALPAQKE